MPRHVLPRDLAAEGRLLVLALLGLPGGSAEILRLVAALAGTAAAVTDVASPPAAVSAALAAGAVAHPRDGAKTAI